jgi:glycosyltransferase involved in cell wall biosynthesis
MIVKNESKVIKRVLDSVADLIDWYSIVDTGSTDNTKKIIKEVMDGHGIKGEIIDHEWVNYCDARNVALEALKNRADWGFWIDADEVLEYDDFDKESLINSMVGYNRLGISVNYSNMKYTRDQFFKVSENWIWEGAVHEVMVLKETDLKSGGVAQGISVKVTVDGNSWGDKSKKQIKAKYKKHAKMLLEYVEENEDPRWIFYLAQSYRDARDYKNAEKWYAKRVEMKEGYWEERYVAQLNLAACMKYNKRPVEKWVNAFSKCSKFDFKRAEHFIPLIMHYQSEENWPMAYSLGKYALDNCGNNPYPKSKLFIDSSCYDWKLLDLHMLSVFYLGKSIELKTLMYLLEDKIEKNLIPKSQLERIEFNRSFYMKQIKPF